MLSLSQPVGDPTWREQGIEEIVDDKESIPLEDEVLQRETQTIVNVALS